MDNLIVPTLRETAIEYFFNLSPDFIIVLDCERNIISANQAMVDRLDGKSKGLTGMKCFQCIHQANEPPACCMHSQMLKDGKGHTQEVYLEKFNGWFSITMTPLKNSKGTIMGSIHIAQNITENVLKEKETAISALNESEKRLQSLFDTMIEGVILIAPDGQIVKANLAAVHILGLSRPEIESRNYISSNWEIIRQDGTPMPPDEMAGPRAMVEKKPIKNIVMGIKKPDDTVTWVNVCAAPILNKDGELHGVVGTFADITDQKKAEDALRTALWRIETIIEGTQIGTWEWNIQTGETIYNEIWANIFGYTLDELAPISHKTWETLIHPDDLNKSIKLLNQYFENKVSSYDFECRMKHKDGHWIWVQDRGRLISRTSNGKPLMIYGINTDITHRKQIEEEIQ